MSLTIAGASFNLFKPQGENRIQLKPSNPCEANYLSQGPVCSLFKKKKEKKKTHLYIKNY